MDTATTRQPLSAEVIGYLLSMRDGGFAFDALREIAGAVERPDTATAEVQLVGRGDPIADLAVAAFGQNAAAVRQVWLRRQSPQHGAAVLANQVVDAAGWAGTVLSYAEAEELLASGDEHLLKALFGNPKLRPDALLEVLSGSGAGAALNADAWPHVLSGLAANPAIGELFDTRRVFPSASERANMHQALLARLGELAPEQNLAAAAAAMLSALNDLRSPASWFDSENLDDLLLHWHPSVHCDASANPCFQVILLLAVLCTSYPEGYETHPFAAVRAARMALTHVSTRSDLQRLADEDPTSFFAGMPYNNGLYERRELGTAFLEVSAYRAESAVAIFLQRRRKLDELIGADHPLVRRDLDRLYEIAEMRSMASDGTDQCTTDMLQSMQAEWTKETLRQLKPPARSAWQRIRSGLIVALLLVLILLHLRELEVMHGITILGR